MLSFLNCFAGLLRWSASLVSASLVSASLVSASLVFVSVLFDWASLVGKLQTIISPPTNSIFFSLRFFQNFFLINGGKYFSASARI
jgi:hypothetical protein